MNTWRRFLVHLRDTLEAVGRRVEACVEDADDRLERIDAGADAESLVLEFMASLKSLAEEIEKLGETQP